MKLHLQAALTALAMVIALTAPAGAADAPILISPAPNAGSEPIVILHTNDVHCAVERYPAVAAQKELLEAQYGEERVTLVDVGDSIQGSSIGTLSDGVYCVELMNAVGYDLAIPGNHEFDYGMDVFLDLVAQARFPYLCSNLTGPGGQLVFAPYEILDYGDTQIAYVGITTPETIGSSTPTHFQDEAGNYVYSFQEESSGTQFYAHVQSAVDAARTEGADYVVALGHLGVSGTTPARSSASLIANTRGIDLLLDGHSHEVLDTTVENLDGEDVPLVQTGSKLANLGCVLLDPDSGDVDVCPISLEDESLPQDSETAALLAQIQARYSDLLEEVAGYTPVDLVATKADGTWAVRSGETNLGDLVADAYRTLLGADVGMVNGGGVRADISAGPVTYGDLLSVNPFANELCLVEVSGQELLDLLEYGVETYPESSGSFPQVSGITFTVDPSVPSSVIVSEHDELLGVAGARRVSNVKIGGEPVDPEKTYTLASHNYMIKSGGSGGTQLMDNKLLLDCVMLDSEALMDYVAFTLGGTIGAEYHDPAGQGRITILAESVARTYAVRSGDCLWNIAARQLGSGFRWQEIYALNRPILKNPNLIFPGQELILPAA